MSGYRRNDSDVRRGDYVYIIRRLSDGKIKIGCTGQLGIRLGALRNMHGAIEVLGVLQGYKQTEAELHTRFASHRVINRYRRNWHEYTNRTDWFEPAQEILDWVAEHATRTS